MSVDNAEHMKRSGGAERMRRADEDETAGIELIEAVTGGDVSLRPALSFLP